MITLDLPEVGIMIEALEFCASVDGLRSEESTLLDRLVAARDAA